MREHNIIQDKKVFDYSEELAETKRRREKEKEANERLSYAIEDGRIDQLDAMAMTLEEKLIWLDKFDNGYDPY